jgi:hypothetical protein
MRATSRVGTTRVEHHRKHHRLASSQVFLYCVCYQIFVVSLHPLDLCAHEYSSIVIIAIRYHLFIGVLIYNKIPWLYALFSM